MKREMKLTVNGEIWEIEIEPHETVLQILREKLNLTGTKEGCGLGACGACTIILDGSPVLSCLKLAVEVENQNIHTIEGLIKDGKPDPIQVAFIDNFAMQCGFCTPGAIMSSKALLDKNPNPSREEIREALAGNLCRCTGYQKIVKAVESAAQL